MKFKRNREEDYALQLIPLIDVVFFLLAFFMISTTFADPTKSMDIELPDSQAGAAANDLKVVEIDINREGEIFFNGEPADPKTLKALITEKMRGMKKRSAIVRADTSSNHGKVVQVMGICKEAGVNDIGVAVRP
ncbi:MAG: biopolymer transporter ExbD [Nitrospinae bacterium]|nr:biopolymer transporter ExbD [Nitrospinota bacterium]